MNKTILIVFLMFFTASLFAQEKLQMRLDSIMAVQESAWNKGDIEGFMQAYWQSDSMTFRTPKGVTYGWQATLERYKRSYPDQKSMGKLKFENTNFEQKVIDGESRAFVAGNWRLEREQDTLAGHYQLHWKKINGEWKIIMDNTDSIED